MGVIWGFFIVTLAVQCHASDPSSTIHRWKRQAIDCDDDQFRCKDGTCIEDYMTCNGRVECPDGSDETFELCADKFCPSFAFRCSYGACISGKQECDGKSNCVDDSDESTLNCPGVKEIYSRSGNCTDNRFQCKNGECVHEDQVCNGRADCSDASDESRDLCFNHYCPAWSFRCDYGACVQGKSRCNRVEDCLDGSDETEALCGRPPPKATTIMPLTDRCVIPAIEHGHVKSASSNTIYPPNHLARNGESLVYVCPNATLVGSDFTYCINGSLLFDPPRCIKGCSTLTLDTLSVRATCANNQLMAIPCTDVVPATTVARLECKTGYKKPAGTFQDTIYCRADGSWSSHVPRCEPECGKITFGVPYISGGRVTNITLVPWHVAIYEMQEGKYTQICGGTIISVTAIISAAHCFWDEDRDEVKDASQFAVVAGKTFRDYDQKEEGMQVFRVAEIKVQMGYQGNTNLFVGDIAVLRLASPIIYQTFICPVCLQFLKFAAKSVRSNTEGRVAGWGLNEKNANSPVLKVVDLYAVDYETCYREAHSSFKPFILPDKFCATRENENVCQGDSGGGFTEAVTTEEGVRYYLRGLVSVGSKLGQVECRANRTYTTFTNVLFYDDLFYPYTQV